MRPAGGLAHPFGGLHGPATHRRPSIRERGRPNSSGYITNISRSGAFVRLTTLPARGSVVELDLSLPDLAGYHTVHAYVVHVAPGRGAGIQFVGASEAFNSDLDRYLARLARQASRRRRPWDQPPTGPHGDQGGSPKL